MMGSKSKKSLLGSLFLGLAFMLILTSPALAVETKWDVLQGDWNNPDNWTNGVPLKNYDVIIDKPGADVTYRNSSNPTLNSLRLGLDPLVDSDLEFNFTQNLEPGQDLLTVKNTEIGSKGTANYYHNGGTHKVLQDLTFGTAADGQGLYYFGGGTLSVGGHETLGLAGEGIMLQFPLPSSMTSGGRSPSLECTPPVTPPPPVGPTHSVGDNLYLGVETYGFGEFNLSESSLTVGGSIRVGLKGTGVFNQDNSEVKIKGNDPAPLASGGTLSSSPVFSAISKKNLKNNKLECVSSRLPGLIVGLENVDIENAKNEDENIDNYGEYNLRGGTLNVNYSEIIGLDEGGDGAFIQTNGTHTINGNLYLGKEIGSFGIFDLSVTPPPSPDTPTPPSVGLLDVPALPPWATWVKVIFSRPEGRSRSGESIKRST